MGKSRRPEPLPVAAPAPRPWPPLLLVALVAVCFGPVLRNGICPVDDRATIFDNKLFMPPRLTADRVGWYWTHADLGLYVPLTETAWALVAKATYVQTPDEEGDHFDPRVFHAASLLVHLTNVVLAYALIRSLLKARWPAFAGAALYGLHPVQVESVAWASGLKDLLYTTASLASVLLYLSAVRTDGPPTTVRRRTAAYVVGLLLVPLGMLCKPTAMIAPLVAAVIDWLLLNRPARRVAWALSRSPTSTRPIANALACIGLLTLGVLSFHQLGYWRTEEGVARHTLAVRPTSFLGHHSLGLVLMRRGDLPGAETEFLAALQEGRAFAPTWNSLATLYALQARPDDAIAAVRSLRRTPGANDRFTASCSTSRKSPPPRTDRTT